MQKIYACMQKKTMYKYANNMHKYAKPYVCVCVCVQCMFEYAMVKKCKHIYAQNCTNMHKYALAKQSMSPLHLYAFICIYMLIYTKYLCMKCISKLCKKYVLPTFLMGVPQTTEKKS